MGKEQKKFKKFIFYSTEGVTFQPGIDNILSDVENCQILGWAKGHNSTEAFENLKIENPWLENSDYNEAIASELKDEKTYYFEIKKKICSQN